MPKVTVSNVAADDTLLITDFEVVFYVDIMTSSELWLTVVYTKLFKDRDLNCGRYLVLTS